MGPWFIHHEQFQALPGISYELVVSMAQRGLIDRYTILRGPTTRQFWTVARRVPGVAHLVGYCHACDASIQVGSTQCPTCGISFDQSGQRDQLGLPESKPLPMEVSHIELEAIECLLGNFAGNREHQGRRRLSSFAPDSQLRSPAPAGMHGTTHAHPAPASGQSNPTVDVVEASRRTMLARQSIVISRLRAVIIILGLACVGLILVLVVQTRSQDQDSGDHASSEPVISEQPAPPLDEQAPPPQAGEVLTQPPSAQPPPPESEAVQRVPEPEDPSPVIPPVMEKAIATFRQSRDAQLPPRRRLELLEESETLFAQVQAEASSQQTLDQVATYLEQLRREVRRIRSELFLQDS
ncbi:MAG: hypothetical protein CMJ32_08675 [Phycisphaerae bacterium]|nr:hypothetical protein [Phycisphaerae bacterium]